MPYTRQEKPKEDFKGTGPVCAPGEKWLAGLITWAVLGNIVTAASQAIIVIGIVRLLGKYAIGTFSLALSVAAPIFLCVQMQLRSIVATSVKDDLTFLTFRRVRVGATVIAFVCCVLLAIASNDFNGGAVLVIVAAAKATEAISDLGYGLLQKHERAREVGLSKAIRATITVIVFIGLLACTENLVLSALGIPLCGCIALFAYDIPVVRKTLQVSLNSGEREAAGDWKKVIELAWPLGFVALLTSLQATIPRYLIDGMLDRQELGVFAATSYFCILLTVITSAVTQSISARLARRWSDEDLGAFRRTVTATSCFGGLASLTITGLTAVFGGKTLAIVYGSDYENQGYVLTLLVAAACIGSHSSLFMIALQSMRRFQEILVSAVSGFCVCLIASFTLIPAYGLVGAGGAAILTNGTVFGVLLLGSRRGLRKRRSENLTQSRAGQRVGKRGALAA